MDTYPKEMMEATDNKSISTRIYGNRFRSDQTLYEYLIEFLLVFSSAKNENSEQDKLKFHNNDIEMSYYVEPRIALRRFIFYDRAKKNTNIEADDKAYKQMIKIFAKSIEDTNNEEATEIVGAIQDLFHGYAVVLKKRSWCAQAMMPICPEVIFCGAMPNEKYRRKYVKWEDDNKVMLDTKFDFDKRNFLARGGEVYYLHLLQGLQNNSDKREQLEMLLTELITGQSKKLSNIANWIQSTWEHKMGINHEQLVRKLNLSYIPITGYINGADNSISELISFLSCNMHQIKRIELMSKGVMFQILRMLTDRTSDYLGKRKRAWIIDMRANKGDTVKKLASISLRNVEDDFMTALNKMAELMSEQNIIDKSEIIKKVNEGKTHSLDIFRSKGKELQCIIPTNGSMERFSLSEDLIRFLVLALVGPQEKMTLKMFLDKLYVHYKIVIGPEEFKKSMLNEKSMDISLSNCFVENLDAFQIFLKETGFLKELSDATSIVVNPYKNLLEE